MVIEKNISIIDMQWKLFNSKLLEKKSIYKRIIFKK